MMKKTTTTTKKNKVNLVHRTRLSKKESQVVFRRVPLKESESVGEILASARESVNRTIADCARKIGIPERYLRALEDEKLESLPGLVYEKHFIYKYAKLLGLSPTPLVSSWASLRVATAPSAQFAPRVRWYHLSSSPMIGRRLLISVALFVLAGYIGSHLVDMAAPPTLDVVYPSVGTVVSVPDFIIKGKVASGATLTVNGQEAVATVSGDFSVPVTLEPGPNIIRIVAEKRYGRGTVVERQVFLTAPNKDKELFRTSSIVKPIP